MDVRPLLGAFLALSSTVMFAQASQATNQWEAPWDTGNWFWHHVKDNDCPDYGTYGVETIYSGGYAFVPKSCDGFIVNSCGQKIDLGPWRCNDYTYGSAPLYGPYNSRWY